MSKHTPGPWVVTTGVKEHDVVTSTHDGVGLDDDVCEVYGGNDDDVSVRRANARLITAAPDLLAALQEYARITSPEYEEGCKRGEHLYPDVDLAAARKAALAAIAKATGVAHE
jgi:hypothetical protein